MFECDSPCKRALRKGKKLHEGVLQVKEESGTVWLWRDHTLLGWRRPITWLFSPPQGHKGWRGDLWGVDSDGELIVVENKRRIAGERNDPFESLYILQTEEMPNRGDEYSAASIYEEWSGLYEQEMQVAVDCNDKDKKTKPGILPYGSHRHALKRWCDLYWKLKEDVIVDPDYPKTVAKLLLGKRGRTKDLSIPYYFGLFTIGDDFSDDFGSLVALSDLLPTKTPSYYARLRDMKSLGEDHVRVAAACARRNAQGRVAVSNVDIKIDL